MASKAKQSRSEGYQSLLIVLSGPSGVGKDAVLARMRKLGCPFHYVVTATTRPQRAKERNGIDYHFLSQEEFEQMIHTEQLIEWAKVYGNYYGVPRDELARALPKEVDVIMKVDVQGAATIKKILPQAVFIFLMPPSMKDLELRLKRRHSESVNDLALRSDKAKEEIKSLPLFDYVVTSYQGKLDDIVSQINAIVAAEKCRVEPRVIKL
ncbi:MAG: guanylate kinase [Dehalococcoidia bacterium]|nr:guanylate kinase [Dehalococcoidia bacterium]